MISFFLSKFTQIKLNYKCTNKYCGSILNEMVRLLRISMLELPLSQVIFMENRSQRHLNTNPPKKESASRVLPCCSLQLRWEHQQSVASDLGGALKLFHHQYNKTCKQKLWHKASKMCTATISATFHIGSASHSQHRYVVWLAPVANGFLHCESKAGSKLEHRRKG